MSSSILLAASIVFLTLILRPYLERYLTILESTNRPQSIPENTSPISNIPANEINDTTKTSRQLSQSHESDAPSQPSPTESICESIQTPDLPNRKLSMSTLITQTTTPVLNAPVLSDPELTPELPVTSQDTELTSRSHDPITATPYATALKSTKPTIFLKNIALEISSAHSHTPVILAFPTAIAPFAQRPMVPDTILSTTPLVSEKIYVLCCSLHRNIVQSAWPKASVTFVETQNFTTSAPPRASGPNQQKAPRTTAPTSKAHPSNAPPQSGQVPTKATKSPATYATPAQRYTAESLMDLINTVPKERRPSPGQSQASSKSESRISISYANSNASHYKFDKLDDKGSPEESQPSQHSSWSDQVEEDERQASIRERVEYAFNHVMTSSLLIEYMLILQRAITSRNPRKAIRGILDTTRDTPINTGFPLSFGTTEIYVYKVGVHRHSMNHIVTTDEKRPPYINNGKPICNSQMCLFNAWPQFPLTLDECRQSAIPSRIQTLLEQGLNTALTLHEDLLHIQKLSESLKTLKGNESVHILKACEPILKANHAATLDEILVSLNELTAQ